ncbi:MAG: IreB family regulatory phosphoprotein [Firmicutes bacterium]|nr:IreB family regulatory phosphoprotein [Bacillota bacterium]
MDETKIYSSNEINIALIETTIREVIQILQERGYDAKNQLIGYLVSGDPGYISSHKEARNKITKFDRIELLEVILDKFLKCDI